MRKTRYNNGFSMIMAVVTFLTGIFFVSIRYNWVFSLGIKLELTALIIIPVAVFIYQCVNYHLELPKFIYWIGVGANGLLLVACAILQILNAPDFIHTWNNIVELLPVAVGGLLVICGYYSLPQISRKGVAKIIVASVSFTYVVAIMGFVTPFTFVCSPVVFDNGQNFVIEFVTTRNAVGYVEIDGKRYDSSIGGLVRTNSNVHKVEVPKAELFGKSYQVGATLTPLSTKNKTYFGASIKGDSINFKQLNSDGANFAVISDLHSNFEGATRAVEQLNKQGKGVDFLVLNGDIISMVNSTRDIERVLIKGMAQISKGQIPVYFVRGNHDMMGEKSSLLSQYLVSDTNEYFYTFNYGTTFSGIVLDSGTGKSESDWALSGLSRDKEYRAKQSAWLDEALDGMKGAYKVQFSHITLAVDNIEKYGDTSAIVAKLKAKGVNLGISGHSHKFKVETLNGFKFIQDGGNTDSSKGKKGQEVIITYIETTPNGHSVYSATDKGVITSIK